MWLRFAWAGRRVGVGWAKEAGSTTPVSTHHGDASFVNPTGWVLKCFKSQKHPFTPFASLSRSHLHLHISLPRFPPIHLPTFLASTSLHRVPPSLLHPHPGPIYVFLANAAVGGKLDAAYTAVGIVASLGAGIVSFLLVEPAFRSTKRTPARPFFVSVAVVWLLLLVFSLVVGYDGVGGIGARARPLPLGDGPAAAAVQWRSANGTNGSSGGGGGGANKGRCLDLLDELEVDRLYRVPASAIVLSPGILETKGWGTAGEYSWLNNGKKPYYVGPWVDTATQAPQAVILGTSHAEMYGSLLKRLAGTYHGILTECVMGRKA